MHDLAPFYLVIRNFHVLLVVLSGTLFAARGVGVQAGAAWPLHRAVRVTSQLIDTALLAAGGTLWWLLQLNPMRDAWLGAKLGLLLVYIVLGSFALKRARSRQAKAACLLAALATIAFMASIALAHDPRGVFAM